ncbi:response regulator [Halosimplex salinum]|uniref:response regulator n=1 Tax=Halosimplex salinum TaxID=1710538 RepID=UPI0013DDAA41|nr:response regulator [Halosimplex salinum]
MNTDNTTGGKATAPNRSRDDTAATRVVLVADRDPTVTDDIAAVLRDSYTVRSAYDSADALASLDPDVSVALLDTEMAGLSPRRVLERVRTGSVDCQVAALTDEALDLDASAFDEYLVKPVAPDHLVETVDRLSRRATYRTTLEEYYQTASERATAAGDRKERLDDRLAELDEQLDDVFVSFEGSEAYDAALRELDVDSC